MTRTRHVLVVMLTAALFFDPLGETVSAQAPIPEATRARVRAFQGSRDRIEITLADRSMLRGRVVITGDDSFTLAEERTNHEVTLQYAQVVEINRWRGNGLPRATQTAITLGVVGAVLLVFCAAPFPLGFICHQDPS